MNDKSLCHCDSSLLRSSLSDYHERNKHNLIRIINEWILIKDESFVVALSDAMAYTA